MTRVHRAVLVAAAVVVASVAGVVAPGVAAAAEPDGRTPTALEGSAYVFARPTEPNGAGDKSKGRVLTAAVFLTRADGQSLANPNGRVITFTSGGLPVCTAVTAIDPTSYWKREGVARCLVTPLSLGGLHALLTLGPIQATFAGDDRLGPSTVTLVPFGDDIRPECSAFCW